MKQRYTGAVQRVSPCLTVEVTPETAVKKYLRSTATVALVWPQRGGSVRSHTSSSESLHGRRAGGKAATPLRTFGTSDPGTRKADASFNEAPILTPAEQIPGLNLSSRQLPACQ